jgi:hypothetical protein
MHSYKEFTRNLVETLTADPRVLGVVALGSMAERGRTPDAFSDHDFFVIANDAEPLRATTEWLPDASNIALWFRETAHGCKAVYDDGHLVEFAVFTPDELQLARVNDYRVLLDRERIEERMSALAARTDAPPDPQWLHGMFLSHILVASGRAQRGELASARWMLAHALRFLVQLLGGGNDTLDPLRRFDHHGIEQAMRLGPASAARALLEIYETEGHGDARAIAAIRIAIAER